MPSTLPRTFATLLLALSPSLVACYGAAPPRPRAIALPAFAEDATIDVHSETRTQIEQVQRQSSTCPQGKAEGDPSCVVTKYTVAEPVSRTHSSATLDGAPLSYAQLKVLGDPARGARLARLDDLAHRCTRANVPRYVGLGLMLGGVLGSWIASSAAPGATSAVLWGGAATGATSYAVGYFAYGGRQCNEARAMYDDLELGHATGWLDVEGVAYAEEMQRLAAQFNASRAAHRRAARN